MRNITNRIATDGFCAPGAGSADDWLGYDDRLTPAGGCLFSDESRVIRELHNLDQVAAATQRLWSIDNRQPRLRLRCSCRRYVTFGHAFGNGGSSHV
jgi:hypothetical protein